MLTAPPGSPSFSRRGGRWRSRRRLRAWRSRRRLRAPRARGGPTASLAAGEPVPGELLVGFDRDATGGGSAPSRGGAAGVTVKRALRITGVQLVEVGRGESTRRGHRPPRAGSVRALRRAQPLAEGGTSRTTRSSASCGGCDNTGQLVNGSRALRTPTSTRPRPGTSPPAATRSSRWSTRASPTTIPTWPPTSGPTPARSPATASTTTTTASSTTSTATTSSTTTATRATIAGTAPTWPARSRPRATTARASPA